MHTQFKYGWGYNFQIQYFAIMQRQTEDLFNTVRQKDVIELATRLSRCTEVM